MIRQHSLLAALLAAACLPTGLAARAVVQPLGPTEADTLAQQMRLLASDPRNMTALATAGELSLRLGDLSGAAALFARADKIDPRSGRVKAGMGSILVRSERPGEALRFFAQAESYGWPVTRYAADRGLAFDLVGQQDRAQRDYRLALANGADDETARRYALSLGISGRQAQALEQLDPLIRRQDRAAWRARAFVMAMNGDTSGAAKIATTMMPAGMAQGLGAFFQRLPTLPAIDRAFAVHFGEIYPTPQRLADARLTPTYAPLPPEAVAQPPVQVAAAVAAPVPDRRSRRERERAERESRRVALAAARAKPVTRTAPVAAAAPVVASASVPAAAMRESDVRVATPAASAPVAVARAPAPTPGVVAAAPAPTVPAATTVTPTQAPVQVASAPVARPTTSVATASVNPAPQPAAVQPSPAPAAPTPQPVVVAAATPSTPASVPVAPVASEAATDRADSVLARIVASLSIPASELGVVEPSRPDPGPVALPAAVARAAPSNVGKRVVAEASAKEVRDATLRRTVAAKLTGDPEADEPVPARGAKGRRGATATTADAEAPGTGRRIRGRKTAAEDVEVAATEPAGTRARGRRGVAATAAEETPLTPAQRRAADRKAAADKKAAAEKKELADKAAAEKKAARGNPARIWVQVAGGANEAALGAAWKTMQGRAATLKTRTGYTTPLRATHRVLTGPFKTDAEARAFVNTLRKEGVAAFSFTSDAGQKIEKLSPSTGAK